MKNSANQNHLGIKAIIKNIGKLADQRPAVISITYWKKPWMILDNPDGFFYSIQEFCTKVCTLLFVILNRLLNIILGLALEPDLIFQREARSLFSTTAHDSLWSPFFERSRSRLSNSSLCHLGTGTFSGVAAIWSHNSWTTRIFSEISNSSNSAWMVKLDSFHLIMLSELRKFKFGWNLRHSFI